MERLIEIFNGNIFYHVYLIKNEKDSDWFIWNDKLSGVFSYLRNNLPVSEYVQVEKYLTEKATLISDLFHPVYGYDENGEHHLLLDNEEKNIPAYPYMSEVLEYVDNIMWKTINEAGSPFIHTVEHNGDVFLRKYITSETKVSVSGTIDIIETGAFSLSPNIEELIFEEGIKTIYTPTKHQDKLKKISLPSTVQFIELYAFQKYHALEEVIFNGGSINFSWLTFEETPWLSNYLDKHQNQLCVECECAFYYEGSDEKLIIPEGVKYIGDFAIASCEIKEVALPDSLELIGISAFSYCENLEKLIIPSNVKFIGAGVFSDCPNLREFYLPADTEMIAVSESFLGSPNVTVYGYKNNRSMQYIYNKLGVPCVFLD